MSLTTLIPFRAIVIALLGGSLAIFANMFSFVMIGKINERVPKSERVSYFWWGTGIRETYKRLYPAGKLLFLADLCLILMIVCFLLLVKFWVFE